MNEIGTGLTCLQVHNDYQKTGGETKTAICLGDFLEECGIKVIRYYKDNKSFEGSSTLSKIRVGINSLYNFKTVKEINNLLSDQHIDFAIVHNVLPIISNSIYGVLIKKRIPVFKYVQNYNLICLNCSLYK